MKNTYENLLSVKNPYRKILVVLVILILVSLLGWTFILLRMTDKNAFLCNLSKRTGFARYFSVPIDAQHPEGIVWRRSPPEGFQSALALMQAVTVTPCLPEHHPEARIEIRAIRLIEHDPATGQDAVVSEVTHFTESAEAITFVGKLFPRAPYWYSGAPTEVAADMVTHDNESLVLDLTKAPQMIYHGWTEPQAQAQAGKSYSVEMEVRISGLARLQMGVDYWRASGLSDIGWDGTCRTSNNCEAFLSDWYGPTDGWVTIRY